MDRKTEAHEALKARILSQALAPGAELDETRLAQEFGLSRTPLREILQALAAEGYASAQKHRGARVAGMEAAVLRAFFQTAPGFLTTAARLASTEGGQAQAEALQEALSAIRDATEADDATAAALATHALLLRVGEMTANPYLRPALNRVLIDYTRLSAPVFETAGKKDRKQLRKLLSQKEALVQAITAQDPDLAAEAMRTLWQMAQARMMARLQPAPLPEEPLTDV